MKPFIAITAFILCTGLYAQSNVSGIATFSIRDMGTDCGGTARVLDVWADVSGMTGDGNALAGINGFAIELYLSRSGLFSSATGGIDPPLSWSMVTHSVPGPPQVLSIVAWNTQQNAPNVDTQLTRVLLTGPAGNLTVEFGITEIASRLVAPGNGPELLSNFLPGPMVFSIPATFNLNLFASLPAWLALDATYDLAAPSGTIDIADLVKLVSCGG